MERYCLEPWVPIEGGITQLLFCFVRAPWKSVLLSSSSHTRTLALLLAHLGSVAATRAFRAQTAAGAINAAQTTACIDWLPFAIMFPLFTLQHLTHSNGIQ